MGMAASQARFLGLTARKTNTEYEGQQVNQQRTALANQSAGLFNRMLTLDVPIAPDQNSFFSMQYTYSDDKGSNKVLSYTPMGGNIYDLNVERTLKENSFTSAGTKLSTSYSKTSDGTPPVTKYHVNINGTDITLSGPATMTGYIDGKTDTNGQLVQEDTRFYSYAPSSSEQTRYIKADQLEALLNAPPATPVAVKEYNLGKITTIKNDLVHGAIMQLDSTGKFSIISIEGSSFPITYQKVDDVIGSEAAMRAYNIDKDNYDKSIADINAETDVIQQQDRTLELRLKQLDTEQSALQTELEAVSKVIDKNVESTFKTFA